MTSDGTVGKALDVLDQVAAYGRPVRFSEMLAASPFPKPTLYRFLQTLTNQRMLAYDPDRAKFHLKQAGLDSLNIDLSASNAAFEGAVDAAQLYQSSAAPAGININVIQEPADGYWSNVWLVKPFSASYWSGRSTEDWMFSSAYEAGVPWNDSQWDNARFQELLYSARAELDSDKRREQYYEMQQILRDDGGVIIPMFVHQVIGLRANCSGYQPHVQNFNLNFETISCD